jgi:rhodanese-related sulfurtransferase
VIDVSIYWRTQTIKDQGSNHQWELLSHRARHLLRLTLLVTTASRMQVQAKIPKDARVIVACQKGLRSLAACEQLARAGYQQLAWINGGLDTARKGNIETTDGKDIR